MEILIECPVCKAQTFENFIKCKDFTVSQELFQIVNCTACGFKFTNPRPGPLEIGKYYESSDYISHSNSSKGIINKIYQVVRKRAINGKIHLINSEVGKSEKSILDIGCGTGEFLAACKSQGWKTKGIEPNDSARSQGINNFGLDVQKEEVLASLTERFEIISMWHVLEHVHLLRTRVKQLYSLLNDRGKAIIAVPNYTSADAEMYKEHWAAYDVPRHLYHFSPDLIKRLFKEEGLTHIKSLPMVYDSFYVSMLSEKYKSGSNNLFSAFRNGFMSNQKAGNNPERYSSVIYIFQKD